MFHANRVWCISETASALDLAGKLTQQTWTLCTGFVVADHPEYLWLNDATHEDGALEVAIVTGGLRAVRHRQIESITFSWTTLERAIELIEATLRGEYDNSGFAREVTPKLHTPAEHGRCPFCA